MGFMKQCKFCKGRENDLIISPVIGGIVDRHTIPISFVKILGHAINSVETVHRFLDLLFPAVKNKLKE